MLLVEKKYIYRRAPVFTVYCGPKKKLKIKEINGS
jgi:hypothetical protein